jgi:hypothetical protein
VRHPQPVQKRAFFVPLASFLWLRSSEIAI